MFFYKQKNIKQNLLNIILFLSISTLLVVKGIFELTIISFVFLSFYTIYQNSKNKINSIFSKDEKILLYVSLGYFLLNLLSYLINIQSNTKFNYTSYIVVCIPLYIFIKSKKFDLDIFGLSVIFAVLLASIYSVYEYNYDYETKGLNGVRYKILFSDVVAIFAVYSGFIAIGTTKKIVRYLAVISVFLGFVVVLFSDSRIALFYIIAVVGLAIMLFPQIKFSYLKQPIRIGIVCLAIVFSGVGLYKLNSGFARVINTVAEITNDSSVKKNNENASSLNRICMWKIAEMLIAEKPIFGHGVKSYNRVKNDWLHNPKNSISNISSCRLTEVETLTNYNNAHNAFIHTWVELGIFGVIVFVLFLFTPIFYFIKNIRNYTGNINTLGWFGLSSQILWILNSMTENITGRSLVFIFMLFNLVLLYTFTENIKNKKT